MIGLGLSLSLGNPILNRPGSPPTICDAIRDLKCITVNDSGSLLKMAPHIVYKRTKKDQPTLDAVLLERDGRPVNRLSMRRYPIEDLSELVILDDRFTVDPDFDASDPAYARGTICVVQAV